MKFTLIKNNFWPICTLLLCAILWQGAIGNKSSISEYEVEGEDHMIGEIALFSGAFEPRGWRFCEGQIFDIESNSALFSILGTQYGGDGRSTFALPDLRGRVPIGIYKENGYQELGKKIGSKSLNVSTVSAKTSYDPTRVNVFGDTKSSSNYQPYMELNYIIAIYGEYPVRHNE